VKRAYSDEEMAGKGCRSGCFGRTDCCIVSDGELFVHEHVRNTVAEGKSCCRGKERKGRQLKPLSAQGRRQSLILLLRGRMRLFSLSCHKLRAVRLTVFVFLGQLLHSPTPAPPCVVIMQG
jgi:hypothetical protein